MKRWWHRRSIRARLTIAYAASLSAILLAYAVGVYLFVARSVEADLNRDLRRDFEVVESMLALAPNGSVHLSTGPHHEHEEEEQIRAEVWDPSGELLIRTAAVGAWATTTAGPTSGTAGLQTVRVGEERIRILQGPHSVSGRVVRIRVFQSEEPIHATLGTLALIAVLGLPVGVSIAAVGGYAIAGRSLAPIARMTERAKTISAEALDERLPVHNPHDELGRLASVFNETFVRLQASFDRLRRFTADASHEIRTPLTSIRSVGEVALQRPKSADAYRDAIGSMLEEVDRLTRLVDSLLTLSRADAGNVPLSREAVDLSAVARRVAGDLAVLAEEKGQAISVSGEPVVALVDEAVLRLSLANLLDNALKYGPPGSVVEVRVEGAAEHATIEVRDQGPGIAPEHRDHVFERFYRTDSARSRALGGVGLGLSIARWAVQAHGGSLHLVDDEAEAGAVFRIRIRRTSGERT